MTDGIAGVDHVAPFVVCDGRRGCDGRGAARIRINLVDRTASEPGYFLSELSPDRVFADHSTASLERVEHLNRRTLHDPGIVRRHGNIADFAIDDGVIEAVASDALTLGIQSVLKGDVEGLQVRSNRDRRVAPGVRRLRTRGVGDARQQVAVSRIRVIELGRSAHRVRHGFEDGQPARRIGVGDRLWARGNRFQSPVGIVREAHCPTDGVRDTAHFSASVRKGDRVSGSVAHPNQILRRIEVVTDSVLQV